MSEWKLPANAICPKDKTAKRRFDKSKSWRHLFSARHNFAAKLQPKAILEIGVRCGYTAYSFLSAAPEASYLGLDAENNSHGGQGGPWTWWAEKLLVGFDAEIRRIDTQALDSWSGKYDLIHIDGDHTRKGALHDMRVFWPCVREGGCMLLDDFTYINGVTAAGIDFVNEVSVEARFGFLDHRSGALEVWREA